ncbi:hypothetical protein ACGTNG_12800 [Halomonas sp. 1390]|uniref:hypothetical protein n=1 Tax=Halomonas sp. B23F22_3 TaxID=3459516 RepID=UPI00373F095C
MKKRSRKLSRRQQDVMTGRSQRWVNLAYFHRRAGYGLEHDRHGFLAPVPADKQNAVLGMAERSPQLWEVLCIVYCRARDGSQYRELADSRAHQRIAAWRARTDDQGQVIRDEDGRPEFEDQLLPIIQQTLETAEASCNPNHIFDRAVIMRPWSPNWPSMLPVLRRLRHELDLTDEEIEQWEAA